MDANLNHNEINADLRVDAQRSADDEQLAGLLSQYWRKGIPSVLLAIVAVLIAGYSYCFVQPSIEQHYRDICARNLSLLETKIPEKKEPDPTETKQLWQDDSESDTANAPSNFGSDERLHLLEQTQLCLRRLIIWNKSDDSLRYQSAQVANHVADWYLHRARSLPPTAKDEIASFVSHSLSERKNASDAMRAVLKLDGKFAENALLWATRQRLQDNHDLPTVELDKISTSITELLSKEENNSDEVKVDACAILIETFVRRSLRIRRIEDVDQQIELQPRALQFFDAAQYASVADLAWAAEAKSITDLASGQAVATKALQAFWGKGQEEASSVETLSAAFRCLLLVNSIKEAQVFLSERIQQIAAFEQPRFRSLTAAACLRQIMLHVNTDKRDTGSAEACQVLFSMSVQLNPEFEQVLEMLEIVGDPATLESSGLRLKELMGIASEAAVLGRTNPASDGLRSLLIASVGLRNSPITDSTLANLRSAIKATPTHAIVASRLAMRLVASDSIRVEDAIKWLSAITVTSPESLVAWSDRAKLHLLTKEYSNAIECFEFMLAKLPGNEELIEAINSAKSQVP